MVEKRVVPASVAWGKACEILARELNISASEITEEKSLREDLEVDSIVALNLIFSFEKELNLTVTEEQVVALERVSDLKELVLALSKQSCPS